jgi:hypothetical protein
MKPKQPDFSDAPCNPFHAGPGFNSNSLRFQKPLPMMTAMILPTHPTTTATAATTKANMFDERATYRAALLQAFANECPNYHQQQLDSMMRNFDKIAATGSPRLAFQVVHEAYGNTDTSSLVSRIGAIIKDSLEKANQSGKTIETNPLTRLREAQKKVAARAGKELEVEIGNPRIRAGLIQRTETFHDGIKEQNEEFKAIASSRGKKHELTLTVRY